MEVIDIKPKDYKLYGFEKKAFSNLVKLRKKRNQSIGKNSYKFKNWYRENRYDINYYFSAIMTQFDHLDIVKNTSVQNIYNKFVDFVFENSHINI